jgi:deoxycytidylate deaminase
MATTYAQSHNSMCLKRHVGAIIVDDTNRAISLGYNENPVGMKPCKFEYGYCFKDNNMEVKLEQMNTVHCLGCGTTYARLIKSYSQKVCSSGEEKGGVSCW